MIIQILIYCCLFIVFIFIASIVFNTLLLFSFLYVDYNVRALYKPQEYPHASAWRYSKNFWTELFYVFGKYYLFPFKWLNLSIKGTNPDTAILLIHGYCRHQSDWLWMRKQLRQTSCPIFCVNLEPNFASLKDLAKKNLPKKIAAIQQQTKCKNIIVVGHSMGGLVGSYYTEFLDTEKLIKAIITIGSPLSGTRVSIVAAGENGKQMCPGSKFLTEMHAQWHKSPHKYYQICSKFDNLIFPWQSALLEHTPTNQQHVLTFTGHLGLLHTKEVATQVNSWIKELI